MNHGTSTVVTSKFGQPDEQAALNSRIEKEFDQLSHPQQPKCQAFADQAFRNAEIMYNKTSDEFMRNMH